MRHFVFSWLSLSILPGFISLSGHHSRSSLVVQACSKGDKVMMQKLFSEGKASPNDLTWNWDGWNDILSLYDEEFTVELEDANLLAVCV